jgi:hypothetical protein
MRLAVWMPAVLMTQAERRHRRRQSAQLAPQQSKKPVAFYQDVMRFSSLRYSFSRYNIFFKVGGGIVTLFL